MSVLKILNDYYNTDAPEKIVDYIIRKAVFKDTFALDLNHAAEQIHAVKGFWCETGGRQMVHFILAFDGYENVSLDNDEIIQIAERFCGLFYGRFQIVYGVHFDSGNIHIHFAMNNVSYIDRKRYLSNRYDNLVLAGSIESITGRTVILRQHRTIKRKQISDTKRCQKYRILPFPSAQGARGQTAGQSLSAKTKFASANSIFSLAVCFRRPRYRVFRV